MRAVKLVALLLALGGVAFLVVAFTTRVTDVGWVVALLCELAGGACLALAALVLLLAALVRFFRKKKMIESPGRQV